MVSLDNVSIVPMNLWDRLVRYDSEDIAIDHTCTRKVARTRQKRQNAPFLHLPTELLLDIISKLDRLDLLSLAMTCQDVLDIALTTIKNDIRATSGTWAGHPLATIGSYLISLPPPFFENGLAYRAAERQDLMDSDTNNSASFMPQRFQRWPARQWRGSMTRVSRDVGMEFVGARAWGKALEQAISRGLWGELGIGQSEQNTAMQPLAGDDIDTIRTSNFTSELSALRILQRVLLAGDKHEASPDCTGGWYLRNLNTHELVEICACGGQAHLWPGKASHVTDQETRKSPVSLDDILITQTCWTRPTRDLAASSFRHVEQGYQAGGSWAGHSFDVVSRAKHERESRPPVGGESALSLGNGKRAKIASQAGLKANGIGWEDVTDKVLLQRTGSSESSRGDSGT